MKKGFTLIELLVVIAIIGILAGIVVVTLGGARERANDARIKAGMSQLRSVAEIIRDTDRDYDCVCYVSPPAGCSACNTDVVTLATDMNGLNRGGQTDLRIFRDTGSGATAYCAEIQLNSGRWFCVDSALRSREYPGDPVCTDGTIRCE